MASVFNHLPTCDYHELEPFSLPAHHHLCQSPLQTMTPYYTPGLRFRTVCSTPAFTSLVTDGTKHRLKRIASLSLHRCFLPAIVPEGIQ